MQAVDATTKKAKTTPVYYRIWTKNSVGPVQKDAAYGELEAKLAVGPAAPTDVAQVVAASTDYSKTAIKLTLVPPVAVADTDPLTGLAVEISSDNKTWVSGGAALLKTAKTATIAVATPGVWWIRIRATTTL